MQAEISADKLRRLDRSVLKVGSTLPGNIRDFEGRVILRAGVAVDEDLIEAVKRRCGRIFYVGPDWPTSDPEADDSERPPSEIIETLSSQHKDSGEGRENRRHPRHPWHVPLTLEIEEVDDLRRRRRQIEVTTHDISQGGFAFAYRGFLHTDTVVRARFDTLPDKPRLTGVVRNAIHLSGNLYRIGVRFVGKDEPDQSSDA